MRTVRSIVGAAVVATASALAADAPANDSKATPPPEDPIAAAKRDLEAIKAAKGGLQQQGKTDLPSFSGVELPVGTQAPWRPTAPKTPAEAAAAKKSANWLVDAMMKRPSATTDPKGRPGPEKTTKSDSDEVTLDELAATEAKRETESSSQSDRKDQGTTSRTVTEPVVNPLTTFMATWMTPQDYKLLQPGLKGEGAADSTPGTPTALPAQSTATGAGPGGAALFGQVPSGRSASAPKDNPFLQDFTAGLASPARNLTMPPPAPVAAALPTPKVVTPPPEPAAQKPAVPAFVKPNDEAKYFKPLKRF